MLSQDRYVESFRHDARQLVDLAAEAPDAAIVGCGDWVATDLVAHLVGVWGFMAHHVATSATERDGSMRPPALDGVELFDRAEALIDELADALADVDPAEEIWTWTTERSGAFYLRRAAQETAVHLWDMRDAVGVPEPLDADIARDGIDELVDVTFPNLIDRQVATPQGSLHLHCTDGPGEWSFELVDGALSVTREHVKADAAIRGSASDLLLALWERVDLDAGAVEVFGDADVAASWTALTR